MTQEELDQFLVDNKEAVMLAARQAILDKVTSDIKWKLPDTISAQVTEFLAKEIAPEVDKILHDEKDGIIAAARAASVAIGDTLSKALATKAEEALSGYRAREVFKSLFGY